MSNSLVQHLNEYNSAWDNAPIALDRAVLALKDGLLPTNLIIMHPSYGTLTVDNVAGRFYVGTAPPNGSFDHAVIQPQAIVQSIDSFFGNVVQKIQGVLCQASPRTYGGKSRRGRRSTRRNR